jgi:dCMP deaminase
MAKKEIPIIPSWDDWFMSMVYLSASKSKDQRTHIGAVVVGPDNEIVSLGYNSFPRGIDDNVPERQLKPEKNYWFAHAERNSIYNATLIGTSLRGCKMYTNGVPCTGCGIGIVQSGIEEVIVDKLWNETNSKEDKYESDKTLEMFQETGIKVRYWTGDLLNLQKYRRGEIIG